MESKSVDDICEWLEERGFPKTVSQTFRGEESMLCLHGCLAVFRTQISDEDLDGDAVAVCLPSSPGPDWLKDVVKVGLRLKVHNALRTLYIQCQPTQVCLLQQNGLTPLLLSQLLPSTPQQDSLELSPTAYGSGPGSPATSLVWLCY